MRKELKNGERNQNNGGYDIEYRVNAINNAFFAYDAETLPDAFAAISNRFEPDGCITAAQKTMLRNIMDMVIEEKRRQEAA